MSNKCGYYPDRSDYHPKRNYKIVQFVNGLGQTWYKIKIVGYLWDSYYKMYHNTDYGWTGFVPYFDSEQEALDHLKRDKETYYKMRLLNTVSSKEGNICEI